MIVNFNKLNLEYVQKISRASLELLQIKCTAAREICERHQVVQLRDPMKPPIYHCTTVLRVSTGAPIWSHYVKKHKPLGQHNNLFQSENISTIIRCAIMT